MNPAYQQLELDYCLKKVEIKAVIAPESFRKQKHYEMLSALVPELNGSVSGSVQSAKSSLRNVIIHSDNKLP
jgi:medium-chain acyl-CoA ligase, mitochondrial